MKLLFKSAALGFFAWVTATAVLGTEAAITPRNELPQMLSLDDCLILVTHGKVFGFGRCKGFNGAKELAPERYEFPLQDGMVAKGLARSRSQRDFGVITNDDYLLIASDARSINYGRFVGGHLPGLKYALVDHSNFFQAVLADEKVHYGRLDDRSDKPIIFKSRSIPVSSSDSIVDISGTAFEDLVLTKNGEVFAVVDNFPEHSEKAWERFPLKKNVLAKRAVPLWNYWISTFVLDTSGKIHKKGSHNFSIFNQVPKHIQMEDVAFNQIFGDSARLKYLAVLDKQGDVYFFGTGKRKAKGAALKAGKGLMPLDLPGKAAGAVFSKEGRYLLVQLTNGDFYESVANEKGVFEAKPVKLTFNF